MYTFHGRVIRKFWYFGDNLGYRSIPDSFCITAIWKIYPEAAFLKILLGEKCCGSCNIHSTFLKLGDMIVNDISYKAAYFLVKAFKYFDHSGHSNFIKKCTNIVFQDSFLLKIYFAYQAHILVTYCLQQGLIEN